MNSQQLQELYRHHAAALVLFARQWCRAPDDALQEAMWELSQCEPPPDDPVAWLYTTTKRRAMNISRSESRRQQHQIRVAEVRREWFAEDPGLRHQDLAEVVAIGLECLTESEREVVVARVWGNLAFEQLGQLLGCSASSAHRRYQAALLRLRELLDDSRKNREINLTKPTDTASAEMKLMPAEDRTEK